MGTPNRGTAQCCEWAISSEAMRRYHDEEWGVASHDDLHLFEMLILEGAQAGLSWSIILSKRENYRQALDGFDIERVAGYDAAKLASLLQNPGIVRNRLKIRATVGNAQAFMATQDSFGSFDAYLWEWVDNTPIINSPRSSLELPTRSDLSDRVAKDLKRRGFRFVGSTITYSYLQAVGLINDHIITCPSRPRLFKTMPASEALLARIAFDPGSKLAELNPIPWPDGLAPTPVPTTDHHDTDPLPSADVLVVTYTVAEARALADVLTPGVTSTDWNDYTKDFSSYLPHLDSRAPARESKRLGSWQVSRIGSHQVVCFKSELHPATDGPDVPILMLWAQIIGDATPKLVITTGTAGGVGSGTELGDVAVADTVRWDCQEQFKSKPWATTAYPTAPLSAAMARALGTTAPLMAANSNKIPKEYLNRPVKIWEAETTVSTDFFAIGDTTDHYGLLKAAPDCRAVEMDDAALGLALSTVDDPPPFLSIRNASDPVMPGNEPISQQTKKASALYERFGYYTTVNSAIGCWAVITAL